MTKRSILPFARSLIIGLLCLGVIVGAVFLVSILRVRYPAVKNMEGEVLLPLLGIVLPIVACYHAARTAEKPRFALSLLGVIPTAVALMAFIYHGNCLTQARQIGYLGLGAPLGYADPTNMRDTLLSFAWPLLWACLVALVGLNAPRLTRSSGCQRS